MGLKTLIKSAIQAYRKQLLFLKGASIGSDSLLDGRVFVQCGMHNGQSGKIQLGSHLHLSTGVVLNAWGGNITVGDSVFIGPYSVLYGHGSVTIGNDCLIAEHCSILSANHTIPHKDRKIRWEPDVRSNTVIGNDVWLGAGARVLAGVTIGDGAVIGAGAVVSTDIPPYSVAVGVPAKVIRTREPA
ncbi:MAG: acyltransferase [Bdellovibrionales bacterium]|nr:acyltransferase [Bdellovibrionales bacterium]